MKVKLLMKSSLLLLLVGIMLVLSACSGSSNQATDSKKIVNIGLTYNPSTLNPLASAGLAATYVSNLMFLPLVDIDEDLTFKPMLADSIETKDNTTFTVKLNSKATWTDGTPVTADDVIFTLKLLANPKVASGYTYMFAILEGLNDLGYLPEGAADISGVKKIDERTLEMKTKAPTTLNIFSDTIGRYLVTLPQSALKDVAPDNLNKSPFFQKPTVTNGPFKLLEYSNGQYVQLEANKDYFKGAPKINQLNFKVLQGTGISTQLQSGEIDMNIPSAGVIPIEDHEKVKGIKGITSVDGPPLSNQLMYINEKSVPDAKVRKAISYAINRELIVNNLLRGSGEVVDGFFTSLSPYLDSNVKPVEYDPDKAKSLLADAGWDSSKTLNFTVMSGDSTLEQAANIVAENLKSAGINVKIQLADLGTMIDKIMKQEYDLGVMTFNLTPINPLPDIAFFLQDGNPNGYSNSEVNGLLQSLSSELDEGKIKDYYSQIQKIASEEAPMLAIYSSRSLGAISDRISGAKPKDFGMFINVHEWDIK